ncbi:MAG: ecotin family protein [Desulfobacteraceae bacterium]|nr:ecotin family protein [Desulfobacteraceae bacterium]
MPNTSRRSWRQIKWSRPRLSLGGEPYLIRYNSSLPVVVYAPEGVAVRYRIWNAEDDVKAMPEV